MDELRIKVIGRVECVEAIEVYQKACLIQIHARDEEGKVMTYHVQFSVRSEHKLEVEFFPEN